MCFQNGLCIMIVFNITEPAIEFCHKNQVDFISFNIIKQPHQLFAVLHIFPCGNALIRVETYNFISV